jgi:hypothetical protein
VQPVTSWIRRLLQRTHRQFRLNFQGRHISMETTRPNKRKRLSHACTRCRSKKVRCDELEPNCTNCVRARVACVTFDPRTLTAARRREAQSQPAEASPSASSHGYTGAPSNQEAATYSPSQQHLATADDEAESPAVSSPLLPVLPRFLHGNSLSVLTQWLDLAFARLGMTQRLHSTYKTIRASEKRPSYAGLTLDPADVLPPYAQVVSAFSMSMGWLFPMSGVSTEDYTPAPSHPSPLHALMHAVHLAGHVRAMFWLCLQPSTCHPGGIGQLRSRLYPSSAAYEHVSPLA